MPRKIHRMLWPKKSDDQISIRVLSGSVLPCCVNICVIFGITLIISTRHDADADDDHDDRVDHRALDLAT